ncbi:MAG: hypothetical protein R6U40_00795, partial [Desulfobacterales bacterium]
ISQSFNVRKVRLMITKFARLEFELVTKPSKSDFLRGHQIQPVRKVRKIMMSPFFVYNLWPDDDKYGYDIIFV